MANNSVGQALGRMAVLVLPLAGWVLPTMLPMPGSRWLWACGGTIAAIVLAVLLVRSHSRRLDAEYEATKRAGLAEFDALIERLEAPRGH